MPRAQDAKDADEAKKQFLNTCDVEYFLLSIISFTHAIHDSIEPVVAIVADTKKAFSKDFAFEP
jgi:hypothetical protein